MIKWNEFFYGTGLEPIDNGRKEIFTSLLRLNDQINANAGIETINVMLKKLKLMLSLQFYSEEARFQESNSLISQAIRDRRLNIMTKLKCIAHKLLRCGNVSLMKHEFYSDFFIDFTNYARDTSRMISMS